MAIDDKIGDGKLWYDINREAAKRSLLSGNMINMNILQVKKYQPRKSNRTSTFTYSCLEKAFEQRRVIEQAKFTYSCLGNVFEKQTKTIEDQGQKQIKRLKSKKKSNTFYYESKQKISGFNK